MGRPKKNAAEKDERRNRTVRMPDAVWETLRIEAIQRHTTVSDLLIEAVEGRRVMNIYPKK